MVLKWISAFVLNDLEYQSHQLRVPSEAYA